MQLNGFPIERKKLAELTKAPYNPRKITPEQAKALQRSLTEFGTVEPIIWNKQTGHIVGGHQRLDALQALGETETDVLIVDMPEEREQALNIALNKISGDWDNGMLSDVLLSMHEELRELTGFSEDEIAALLPKQEGLTDPDAIPEVVEPVARLGDIWQLGEHRLMCGDSTDAGSVALLMNGERCDMVFTDPPYGIDYSGGRSQVVATKEYGKILGDNNKDISRFVSSIISLAGNKDYYICLSPVNLKPALSEIDSYDAVIVWKKPQPGLGYQWVRRYCEFIIFGTKREKRKADRSEFDFWEISTDTKTDYVHGTQKPVALSSRAIEFSSVVNDIVCDLFLGSGSTLIACEKLNRKCYGIELDPHYCDVIIKRWEDFTGKKAVKVA